MIPHQEFDQPPRAASWLLSLFATGEEQEHLLGDLSEEYCERESQAGRGSASRWYWRQIVKSLPHLLGLQFRNAPIVTILALAAGFVFRKLMAPRIEPALFALIDRTQLHEHHFNIYLFLASTGIDIAHLVVFLMAGVVVGIVARRREMAPAIALSFIYAGLTAIATCVVVVKFHDLGSLLRLKWYLSDDLAIVLGAALVRTMRTNRMRLSAQ